VIPLPDKKYQIIYADPPWQAPVKECIAKKSTITKDSSFHYQSLTTKQICELPIQEITDDNALLFLWVRSPMLEDGLLVGKRWGFIYRTIAFVWHKQRANPGHYTMSECEICLVFKKGKIPPKEKHNIRQFLSEKRTVHSKKPDEIRRRIEYIFPKSKKIELFARQKSEGWDVWGLEVSEKIKGSFNCL
jgi:N6-adenosine-specific RNA methylase IME4